MRSFTPLLFVASLATSVVSVAIRRDTTPDRSNVVTNSKITDPNQECSPYWYPPSDNYPKFPDPWVLADIVSGDTTATAKWNSIKGKILNTKPKGTNGVFSNDTYDDDKDPDCWWTSTLCTKPKASGIPSDVTTIPEPMALGYGFDDGPNCSHNAFYDYMQQNNQKATMYFIGSNVIDWPLEAQRALYDGHEICAHSWSHNAMTTLTSQQAFAEIWYTIQAIKAVTGVTVTCWRPPYGDTDDRIRSIVNALGLSTIIWEYDSDDWEGGPDVDTNYQSFLSTAKGGAFNKRGTIYLQHEIDDFTMGKAMQYYPDMKSTFKALVPVAVGLNKTHPYVETNIEFPTFSEYISGTVQKPLPASALSFLGVTATSTSASSTATSSSSVSKSSSTVSSPVSSTSASKSSSSSSGIPSSSSASRASSGSASSATASSSSSPSSSSSASKSSSGSSSASSSASSSSTSSSVSKASSSGTASSTPSSSSSSAASISLGTTSASASASASATGSNSFPTLPANPTKEQLTSFMSGLKSAFESLMAAFANLNF